MWYQIRVMKSSHSCTCQFCEKYLPVSLFLEWNAKCTFEWKMTLFIKACPYFYCRQTWIKWIVCITWKNIPKLATSCKLSHSSKWFKVRAMWVLRDLYENKIQGLRSLTFMFYTFQYNSWKSSSRTLKLYRNIKLDGVFWIIFSQSCKLKKL